MEELTCYNNGCGQKYKSADNKKDSCRHHPGGPIFHDALKGWSCCKKRTCDFTEFLNIPGCTYGVHNNVKPDPPEGANKQTIENNTSRKETIIQGPMDEIHPLKNRPSEDEVLIPLKTSVGASLKSALAKSRIEMALAPTQNNAVTGDAVPIGTSCKNNACRDSYVDEMNDLSPCLHHPGVPVFHEGMKFWSCCQRKTTEFDNFMAQEGCASGKHLWFKKSVCEEVMCRTDWHQTDQFVTISVFAKLVDPERTTITCNQVVINMCVIFQGGKSTFDKKFVLKGRVDPTRSNVKLLGTKVEVNLRKADPGKWSALELPPPETLTVIDNTDDGTEAAVASL